MHMDDIFNELTWGGVGSSRRDTVVQICSNQRRWFLSPLVFRFDVRVSAFSRRFGAKLSYRSGLTETLVSMFA